MATTDRLARLLDTPFVARVVPHLAPETLHQLIRYRGLDACGELVTCATPAQLNALADLDLWRHPQAGRDEQFDADRFGEWLDVLVDTGDSVAARTVAALDAPLVILGLSRYVRVFDPGTFEPTESSDDEPIERDDKMKGDSTDHVLEREVGGYVVRAGRTDAWDAIVALLVALESEHNHYFHTVMRGCRRLSNSRPEVDGLDAVLMAPEQQLHDVGAERERRRSGHGYTTPADARAFLQMARQSTAAPALVAGRTVNPIATAYFRALDEDAESTAEAPPPTREEVATTVEAITALLIEAGVMPERPLALLEAPDEDPRAARLPILRRLMAFALSHDVAAYGNRSRELAFLANTLLAGSSVQSRPFTAREASEAVAATCNLALEGWTAHDSFLVDHDLVTVFEAGWSRLYREVSLSVMDQLLVTLAGLDGADGLDADARRGLRVLRRTLKKARAAGTPWLARDAAGVLATLDMTAWAGVLGLLDECPHLPEALTAVLERRKTAVSPSAFAFISTAGQVGDVSLFMRALPAALSP